MSRASRSPIFSNWEQHNVIRLEAGGSDLKALPC
jgi:hypothetical protein